MSTMADGAAQRLDAQIADALFGQPGMSKMDVANRLRQLRGAGAPLLCGSCYGLGVIGYTSGQTPEQFEQGEYPCPDCAQPSPAGQDTRAQFEVWAKGRDLTRDTFGVSAYVSPYVDNDWEVWQAALASRQPGAQEPVAVVGSDFTICWVGSGPITPLVERHGIKRGSLLYATAPAQGMDLGQFRDLIGFAVLHAIYLPESDPRRDFIRQANELLALIDSRPTLATVTPPRDLRTQLGEA